MVEPSVGRGNSGREAYLEEKYDINFCPVEFEVHLSGMSSRWWLYVSSSRDTGLAGFSISHRRPSGGSGDDPFQSHHPYSKLH